MMIDYLFMFLSLDKALKFMKAYALKYFFSLSVTAS